MKPRIYISTILLGLSMLFTAKVKADDHSNKNNSNNPGKGSCTDTTLPIDSGIVFLAIAGTAIGIFAVKRAKMPSNEASFKA